MKLSKFYPLSLILAALFLFAPAQSTAQSGPSPRKAEVLNGIDVLKKDAFASLKGKKIGLLTNQTGRDKEGNSTIDLLFNAPESNLGLSLLPSTASAATKTRPSLKTAKTPKPACPSTASMVKTANPRRSN